MKIKKQNPMAQARRIRPAAVDSSTPSSGPKKSRRMSKAKRIQSLSNQVEKLESQKSRLQQRAAKLRSEISTQEEAIDHTHADIEETRSKLQGTQDELNRLGRALEHRHRKLLSRLGVEFISMRHKATGCTKKIDEVEQTIQQRLERSVTEAIGDRARAVTPVVQRPKTSVSQPKLRVLDATASRPRHEVVNTPAPRAASGQDLPEYSSGKVTSEVVAETEAEDLDLHCWVQAQLHALHDVEGLDAEDIKKASENIEPELEQYVACDCTYKKAKTHIVAHQAELTQLRSTLRKQTARCESLNNELKSVELQLVLIQAEIDCINFLIECMKHEAELEEEAARRRDEEAAIRDVEERAARQAADEMARFEELRGLHDAVLRSENALESSQTQAFYEAALVDALQIRERSAEVRVLIEQVQTQQMRAALTVAKEDAQIDKADNRFEAIIGYLKTLVSSGNREGAASCALPTGVRMTGALANALNEMAQLNCLLNETKDDASDDIVAQSQREARQATLQRMIDGVVPEPRDIKCLAVNSNAPTEWVAQLDSWTQKLDELAAFAPKHGQLKGVIEQQKMTQLSEFVDFLHGLGSENFLALLEGRALDVSVGELSDSNSNRRRQLDSVLDGLFCA
jgi:hypothetical protein